MAETKFKKVDFEDLSASTKSVIEANAASQGVTPEQYYESRGGVNRAGYFGDAYQAAEQGGRPYLSDEQYFAALEGLTGVARGQAINLATAKNQYDIFISQGLSSADASARSGYDPATNSLVSVSSGSGDTGGTGFRGSGSTTNLAAQQAAQAAAEEKRRQGQSAYNLLFEQFNQYGLGALVAPLQGFIVEGLSPAEFTLRLRDTDAYKKRFAANQSRTQRGLRALSEAEYIGLEDQYQSVMRQYGLPQSYYSRGDMGRQEGFEKFIAGDVSPVELEDRIQTAQNRVTNAPKQVRDALTQFYGAELGNGDILAYVLDPEKALSQIKRKVTAAEIGGGAAIAGLGLGKERAEELGMFGVTGEQARTGYQTIAEFLPTATKLGDIYAKQGLGPYTQTAAESEVFGVTGAADASQKRRKLAQLESAQFSGTSGAAQGALARERAGQY
jgi:hypothetical protein